MEGLCPLPVKLGGSSPFSPPSATTVEAIHYVETENGDMLNIRCIPLRKVPVQSMIEQLTISRLRSYWPWVNKIITLADQLTLSQPSCMLT